MLENILAIISILFALSLLASKVAGKVGVPALLVFLLIGMIVGPEGPAKFHLKELFIAQYTGIVALIFILFFGGFETDYNTAKPVIKGSILLSTAGVFLTAIIIGMFSTLILKFSVAEGLLLGAIVSSTDAAAVFSVLKSKKVSLKERVRSLLEVESGSNDPMAVLLTLALITFIMNKNTGPGYFIIFFLLQMGVGALGGFLLGKSIVYFVKKIRFDYDGLYPVLSLSLIFFFYAFTSVLKGNGFLTVYIAGLIVGNSNMAYKRTLRYFYSGIAWVMQIIMFLTLGVLVFPSKLLSIWYEGLILSFFLMFIARPVSVFTVLLPCKILKLKEILFACWVGLRGSVPIILATFPLISGLEKADLIFNIVFFIVVTSVLLQGTSIPFIARFLGVDEPLKEKIYSPLELEYTDKMNTRLIDFIVPYNSPLVGKTIAELKLPEDSLITLVVREENFIVPSGKTVIEVADVLLVLVNDNNFSMVQEVLYPRKLLKTTV